MQTVRQRWLHHLSNIVSPVLEHAASRTLRARMPVECQPGTEADRALYTHLEAVGRTLAGMAPWLELENLIGEEQSMQSAMRRQTLQLLQSVTDPASSDFLNFSCGRQPLVDAAFLAHAILRAPRFLCRDLPQPVKAQLATQLRATRICLPYPCNWLLFSAMVEAALFLLTGEYDGMRVDYALRAHQNWYKGDGVYGDGEDFHWDFYNSYVIQPMLIDILDVLGGECPDWQAMCPTVEKRAQRYAQIQERLIAPDGSFPAIGRSLAYRFGAFQHLAQMALQHRLPETLPPEQVRTGLSAVVERIMAFPDTFDNQGWLTIGLCGRQPEIGEGYISTGSLYLCTTVFLPLGLQESDRFWSGPDRDWTGREIWSGRHAPIDHALHA